MTGLAIGHSLQIAVRRCYERFVKTNHKNFVSAAPAITYADSRSFASRGMCRVMRGTQPFQIAAIPESSRVAVMFDAMVDLRRWFDTLLLLTVDAERVARSTCARSRAQRAVRYQRRTSTFGRACSRSTACAGHRLRPRGTRAGQAGDAHRGRSGTCGLMSLHRRWRLIVEQPSFRSR